MGVMTAPTKSEPLIRSSPQPTADLLLHRTEECIQYAMQMPPAKARCEKMDKTNILGSSKNSKGEKGIGN